MRIVILDLDKINLDYINFDEDDPETLGIVNLNNLKDVKKI